MFDLEIRLENRPGALAEMGEALGSAGVSVEGGGGWVADGKATMHFLFADGEAARKALEGAGIEVLNVREVLTQKLRQDVPGQLGEIARRMSDAGVNIEVVYSDHANQLILAVDDFVKGKRGLRRLEGGDVAIASKSNSAPALIPVVDIDEAILHYTSKLGYRLDMIVPADSPREALLSNNGRSVRLMSEPPPSGCGTNAAPESAPLLAGALPLADAGGSDFVQGRAGMEYRDLIPGRHGGKIIASHIRLTAGGLVPDYVHYHKADFQMIYCLRGRIKVVYEDQGPPFWLETGDCVLQPPEIRHRVLESTAGAEVIEVGMPAVHETWVEHELSLPTSQVLPEREFVSQRFVRHIGATAVPTQFEGVAIRETGISRATHDFADVRVLQTGSQLSLEVGADGHIHFGYVVSGGLTISVDTLGRYVSGGEAFVVESDTVQSLQADEPTEFLYVRLKGQERGQARLPDCNLDS